jgi:hypothetical protein
VKIGLPFFALALTVVAMYALSQGMYVGSNIYRSPYVRGQYDKDCRYLSFNGIRSMQAGGGPTPETADGNGFCPFFHKQFPH